MCDRSHSRRQGDIGEAKAITWLTEIGAIVWVPLFHSPDADVIAELAGRMHRVQVKTSRCRERDRFVVNLATRGGNRSWTGTVKHFDRSRCDFLFAYLTDGRSWFIPSAAVDGATAICLGGPKYSEYEVKTGAGLPPASRGVLECASLRGSAVVGETGGSVKSVPSAEWVRFPPPPFGKPCRVEQSPVGRSRLSSGHQMTVPIGPWRAADLSVGDQFEVVAEGPGQIRLSRVHIAQPVSPDADQQSLTTPARPAPEEAA